MNNGTFVDISLETSYTQDGLNNKLIAELNPFRYRGYYYDIETGLYYLNSRYYDPEIGRFINADDISYLDPESINGLNLYAYCINNPIINIDVLGTIPLHSYTSKYSINKIIWEFITDKKLSNILGNITLSITNELLPMEENGFFYSYSHSSFGSTNIVATGIGINAWGWAGIDVSYYVDDNFGITLKVQTTPWLHSGISLGTNGIGINIGLDINQRSYDLNITIGWGTLVFATAVVAVAYVAPILSPVVALFGWLFKLFS